ncbi:MAG: bifunctional NADH dehydrogenase FAD-containing subunit/selenide, water dikinase SelD, partial [Planctomycetaceae bacterium]
MLLGAGHAHLHVIRMWGRQPIPGFGLTVVNDSSLATYSGMYPGVIAGLYSKTEASVDLWRFVPACGGRLIVAPVQGFDASARRVLFADRPPLAFDIASIALG